MVLRRFAPQSVALPWIYGKEKLATNVAINLSETKYT